jgi:hypothetical protein
MRKLLCFIGLHGWAYSDSTHRECLHCKRREVADVDHEYNAIYWFHVD